jgi:hypothetical protein
MGPQQQGQRKALDLAFGWGKTAHTKPTAPKCICGKPYAHNRPPLLPGLVLLLSAGEENLWPQAWDCGCLRNWWLPEIYCASHPKVAFPVVGEGNHSGFQNSPEVSECSHWWLQQAGEAYRLGCLEILICVPPRPRVTILPKDIQLTHQIQGDNLSEVCFYGIL